MAHNDQPDLPSEGVRGELSHDRYIGDTDLTRWDSTWILSLSRIAHRISYQLGAE